MMDDKSSSLQSKPSPEPLLASSDSAQIVVLSGLWSRTPVPNKPTLMEIVWYKGKPYKVRAYPNKDIAQRQFEYMSEVKNGLFTRCYGRIDRYLILDYVPEGKSHRSAQILLEIGSFLSALAKEQTRTSIEHDFDQWCAYMDSAGIFLPQTIELIRRYYESRTKSLGLGCGLEHYDAIPQNFVTTKEGRFLAIDEKHLDVGPRGVGLIKAAQRMAEKDFLKVKESCSKELDFAALEDPECQEFLMFYRHKRIIYWRSLTARRHRILRTKRQMLQIIRHSLVRSLREKLSWELDYRFYRPLRLPQQAIDPRRNLWVKSPLYKLHRPDS